MRDEELSPDIKACVVSRGTDGTFEVSILTDRLRTHRIKAGVLSSIGAQIVQALGLTHQENTGANIRDVTSIRKVPLDTTGQTNPSRAA